MKKILKLFSYLILLIFFILILLPKESIYNYIEHQLSNDEVIISNENRDEKLLSLNINNADIYYEGIKIANIDKTSFLFFFFYNEVNINNIRIEDSLSTMIPSSITNVKIKYTILDYEFIHIKSIGSFGKLEGTLNILNKKLFLKLEPSSLMKTKYNKLLKNMKLKDGKYIWEKNL